MRKLFLTALILLAGMPAAKAQWLTHVSASDVFGNRTVLAASVAPTGGGLTIQCNQKDSLELAYLFPVTAKDLDEMTTAGPVPVTLLLKVDNEPVRKFQANMEPWNNRFAGFIVSGREYNLLLAIEAIGKAQNTVSVGAEFLGNKQSDNFSSVGSTSAMNTIIKDCNLQAIKQNQSDGAADDGSNLPTN